jgi:hypothetical protein
MMVGKAIAEAAARELISAVREMEGRQVLVEKLSRTENARATLDEIGAVVEVIGKADAPHRQRLVALSRLAKAITTSAAEHSLVAMNALSETGGHVTHRSRPRRGDHVRSCSLLTIVSSLAWQAAEGAPLLRVGALR